MYRRKYRSGSATSLRPSAAATNAAAATSTPARAKSPEPVAGTSSVLREQNENVPTTSKSSAKNPLLDSPSEVPASQMLPPSRYISQRSIRMRSQLLEATQRTPRSYFDGVIERSGVKLCDDDDVSYTIYCDHSKFVCRLRNELKTHSKYPENVQSFLSGLQEMMKSQTRLTKLLSGCIVSMSANYLWNHIKLLVFHDFSVFFR